LFEILNSVHFNIDRQYFQINIFKILSNQQFVMFILLKEQFLG